MPAVLALQARGFHDGAVGVAPLDQLSFKMFEAEVADALRKKVRILSPESFRLLVAEGVPAAPLAEQQQQRDTQQLRDQATAATSAQQAGPYQTAESVVLQQGRRAEQVVGVVEVSLQDFKDVLQMLPGGLATNETYAYVASMAVAAQERRRGLALAMLQSAEAQALQWGQRNLVLHVYEDNVPAVQLYTRYGMQLLSKDPSWRKLLGGRIKVTMYKDLTPQLRELAQRRSEEMAAAMAQQQQQQQQEEVV